MNVQLQEIISGIGPINGDMSERARERWNSIAKPLHSLGKLETVICQLAGIYGRELFSIEKKRLLIMCADNGVVEEGVTQSGQEITGIVAENFLTGQSTAAIFCKLCHMDLLPVDIGMVSDTPHVIKRKVRYGTSNMKLQPAMTRQEAEQCLITGIQLVLESKEAGYHMIATGEMGIGNTTTSSAIASILLQLPVEEVTGRGAGLTSAGLKRKIEVIKESIEKNKPDESDPIDILSKVGGFDIGGLVGIFLGGAYYRMPVVIDGFISCVAALLAIRINPLTAQYCIPSHVSKEPAGKKLLEVLAMDPFLYCDMAVGEGSGAAALMPLLDMANEVYQKMGTFTEHAITPYEELL